MLVIMVRSLSMTVNWREIGILPSYFKTLIILQIFPLTYDCFLMLLDFKLLLPTWCYVSTGISRHRVSVCPLISQSVCLSITCQYYLKMAKRRILQTMPHDRQEAQLLLGMANRTAPVIKLTRQ